MPVQVMRLALSCGDAIWADCTGTLLETQSLPQLQATTIPTRPRRSPCVRVRAQATCKKCARSRSTVPTGGSRSTSLRSRATTARACALLCLLVSFATVADWSVQQTDSRVHSPSHHPREPHEWQGHACSWHAGVGSHRVSGLPSLFSYSECDSHMSCSCEGTKHHGTIPSRSLIQSSRCTNISDSSHPGCQHRFCNDHIHPSIFMIP
jgi:hypothetical protein